MKVRNYALVLAALLLLAVIFQNCGKKLKSSESQLNLSQFSKNMSEFQVGMTMDSEHSGNYKVYSIQLNKSVMLINTTIAGSDFSVEHELEAEQLKELVSTLEQIKYVPCSFESIPAGSDGTSVRLMYDNSAIEELKFSPFCSVNEEKTFQIVSGLEDLINYLDRIEHSGPLKQ